MAQFNQLSLADTYGRGMDEKQASEFNALRVGAVKQQQAQFDEQQLLDNTRWLQAAAKSGLERIELVPQIIEEGKRRGIIDPGFALNRDATPEMIRGGLQSLYDEASVRLQGVEQPEVMASGTAPMQNYAERQRLVEKFGESSQQVKTFDAYVRAPSYQTIGGVPTQLGPSGRDPLSTIENEADAAAAIAEAKSRASEKGKTDVQRESDAVKLAEQNDRAYRTYAAAMRGVEQGMAGTTTNPAAGAIPPLTAEAQIAEGSTAAMAPILKQLFRAAGEGVFTDRDQQLLLDMVPTRKDYPEARQWKIDNINMIVRAKLGINDAQPVAPEADFQAQWDAAPSGAVLQAPDGTLRRKP